MDEEEFRQGYLGYVRHKILFTAVCVILVFVALAASCLVDGRPIGVLDVYRIIWEHIMGATYEYATPEYWDDYVVVQLRLPRAVLAIIAGMGLAVCGVSMQSIMSNPLADAYTTGISSGACLGAIMALAVGFGLTGAMAAGTVTMAFIMALVPAMIVIFLSRLIRTTPATLILIGTAISYLFGSINTMILVYEEGETLSAAYEWTVGSLNSTLWSDLALPSLIVSAGCIIMILMSRRLNVMMAGDDEAQTMGLDVENFRTLNLLVMSLMVASIICFTGILGFIGLIAPHIVRMFIGSDNRFVIPASMALGACLLLIADIISRLVIYPYELPVGIILMFVGGPLFLYLVVRKKDYGGMY